MRFQLVSNGWPVNGGATVIPVGSILDSKDWHWNGTKLPWPPPLNALCLDNEARNAMRAAYNSHLHHLILFQP